MPECRELLTDYADARGRTLRENLELTRLSAADYAKTIPFLDGSFTRSCKRGEVLLVTSPGQPLVDVCPPGKKGVSSFAGIAFGH